MRAMKSKEELADARQLQRVKVTSNREISPGVYYLSYQRTQEFIPGQVVKVSLAADNPPRIYSICSGNSDPEISILFNIKEGGLLTPELAKLKSGDTMLVSAPYGGFISKGEAEWWISTGTGIAPFYSMLRSGLGKNCRLIHGVRNGSQFYFQEEIQAMMGEQYITCCSGEKITGSFYGRVTDWLSSCEELPTGIKYYLCGKALMVVDVRDLLIEKGIPFDRITSEIYF